MLLRVASAFVVLAALNAVPASAQSLAAVAAEEAARRRAITQPARVLTDGDLQGGGRPATPPEPRDPSAQPLADAVDAGRPRQAHAPATFVSGALPPIAIQAMGGGDVLLELSVTEAGKVDAVKVLRHTPPFTEGLVEAARRWTFQPAEDVDTPDPGAAINVSTKRPMPSTVLVMGLFRPPALFPGTYGVLPEPVGRSSEGTPMPRGGAPMPLYPPNALFDGVVLAELTLSASGAVDQARIVRSAPAFDQPTLDVVKALSFSPPLVHGRPARSRAYVVAAFRQPITP